jgi:hypothetical protein
MDLHLTPKPFIHFSIGDLILKLNNTVLTSCYTHQITPKQKLYLHEGWRERSEEGYEGNRGSEPTNEGNNDCSETIIDDTTPIPKPTIDRIVITVQLGSFTHCKSVTLEVRGWTRSLSDDLITHHYN